MATRQQLEGNTKEMLIAMILRLQAANQTLGVELIECNTELHGLRLNRDEIWKCLIKERQQNSAMIDRLECQVSKLEHLIKINSELYIDDFVELDFRRSMASAIVQPDFDMDFHLKN